MLYNLLGKLFRQDVYSNRFTPTHWHLFYAVALLFIGSGAIAYDWIAFGLITFIFGIGLGATVLIGINWDKAIEYWAEIAHVLEAAGRIKDPVARAEILQSMGYNVTPQSITIIETEAETNEHGWQQKIGQLPVPASVMQIIADKVLMSGKASFTEPQYKTVIPNYRKVQKELKEKKYLIKTKDGHVFNKKGIEALYEYASESVKLEMKRKRDKNG